MSLMDLSGTIASLATGTYAVTRRAAGTVSGGIVTDGAATTLSVNAVAVPAEPEHLERLPEGTRLNDVRVIYSATPLLTSNEATGTVADRINIDGNDFEVESVRDLQGAGAYTQALARRVDPS